MKMKKLIVLLVMVGVMFLAACGDSNETSGSSNGSSGSSNESSGSSNGTSNDNSSEMFQMILTNETAMGDSKSTNMQKFIDLVEEKSNGRIKAELFPAAQLYSDADAVAALGSGAVHIVWPATGWLESLNEAVGIMRLPFALNDELMLNDEIYRQGINEFVTETLAEENIQVLGQLRSTEYIILTKDKELDAVEDFNGLKVRVSGGDALIQTLDELGATAISMPSSEAASALSQGTIDAILTSPNTWANSVGDLSEQGLIMPSFLMSTYTMVADQKWFNNLPDDLQKVIMESADEVASKQWQDSKDEDKVNFEKIKEFANINTLSQADLDELAKTISPVIQTYRNKFPEKFDRYAEIQKNAGLEWPKE
jgi:TRAP-type C4-dicarboxylate transport system substrate-binding protein